MKALRYILLSLVIAAAIGLLCYQAFIVKNLDNNDLVRAVLIIIGAVLAMFKSGKRTSVSNKKALYQKSYAEHIMNAFSDDPKLEKRFYNAVHDYNQNKPAAGIAKLEKLRRECQRSADLRAVTVFMALCYDDMKLYDQAIAQYDAALRIRPSSSLYSNMGLCYQRLGKSEEAERSYRDALTQDPKNAFAWNNLATHYFRLGDYRMALEYAREAIAINAKMPQALGAAAICCGLLGEQEEYEKYYRQAVANGYDGNKIKSTIRAMDPST